MATYPIHFTIDEAREALPTLRTRLFQVRDLLVEIRSKAGQAAQVLRGNGHGPVVLAGGPQKNEIQKLITLICDAGIIIKDLEQGLVDFPHFLGGRPDREVLLCWRMDEDTIGYWHEIETGYAGRRPI